METDESTSKKRKKPVSHHVHVHEHEHEHMHVHVRASQRRINRHNGEGNFFPIFFFFLAMDRMIRLKPLRRKQSLYDVEHAHLIAV